MNINFKDKIRYFLFYFSWILFVYLMFSSEKATFDIKEWDYMSRLHFSYYGYVIGAVLTLFYYIDENFNIN